ncbi:YceD family protein [Ottowia thiooxydans]|uniref:YceD family protein n=1 Tax=Ottowia thiooxydans TaxID=219182 RepID=UPI000408E89B|nr:YceD family protein [Ottowia thiooxydans]
MSRTFSPQSLDVAAFSQANAQLSGRDSLQDYERLSNELRAPATEVTIEWRVEGEHRRAVDGATYPALHLHAAALVPLTCQLCMGELAEPLEVDRHFIFVEGEDAAATLDDASEDDDVLTLSAEFDLQALIEDELIMALPLVPRHEECPEVLPRSVQDADFETALQDKPKPFAALASLKIGTKPK